MQKKAETKKKIALVDDHPMVREGLVKVIEMDEDLAVCGQASTAAEAVGLIQAQQPNLTVVDISLGEESGLELIKDLRKRFPAVKVLALSMLDELFYARRALQAGAQGYVMKEAPNEEVLVAIRAVLDGKVYLSEKVSTKILQDMVGGQASDPSPLSRLSTRELEVFELIGKGLSTRQIAQRLSLSTKTIEAHRANIKSKLNLADSSDLLQQAIHWAGREPRG